MLNEDIVSNGLPWYESYTCTMEYRESALDVVDLNILYPKGYSGTGELQYA